MPKGNPHPKPALKNLKPFKKGSSGNPKGRGFWEGLIKDYLDDNNHERAKQLVRDMYDAAHGEIVEEVTETTMMIKKGRGKDAVKMPGIEKKVRRYRERDLGALHVLLERGWGKVKDVVQLDATESLQSALDDLFEKTFDNNIKVPKEVTPNVGLFEKGGK